jgi:hypothetical protein
VSFVVPRLRKFQKPMGWEVAENDLPTVAIIGSFLPLSLQQAMTTSNSKAIFETNS